MERDKEQAKVKIFNWKANFSELKRDLAQVDWKRRLAGKTVNEQSEAFRGQSLSLFPSHFKGLKNEL